MIKWANAAMLAAAAALWQGCATDHSPSGSTQVGRVEGIYIEAYPGLFVDRAVATVPGDTRRWVSLSFTPPLDDGRRTAMATLEGTIEVEPGDLVQVQVADHTAFSTQGKPESNQVTGLVARRGNPSAATFGQRPRAPGWRSAAVALP